MIYKIGFWFLARLKVNFIYQLKFDKKLYIRENLIMENETGEHKESGLEENLKAVGQIIVGEIETIGGILTGDPMTRAEGEFNVEVGSLHQESNKNLTAIENNEEAARSDESNQTENNK